MRLLSTLELCWAKHLLRNLVRLHFIDKFYSHQSSAQAVEMNCYDVMTCKLWSFILLLIINCLHTTVVQTLINND